MYALVFLFVHLNGAPPQISEVRIAASEAKCNGWLDLLVPEMQTQHPDTRVTGFCVPIIELPK